MKTYYSLESAKEALKTLSSDEKLTLKTAINTAESLLELGMDYFYDEEPVEEDRQPIDIFNLFKKVNCLASDPDDCLLNLELMVACGGPNIWVKVDDGDNVTVQCYWGDQAEIRLGTTTKITLEAIRELYSGLVDG